MPARPRRRHLPRPSSGRRVSLLAFLLAFGAGALALAPAAGQPTSIQEVLEQLEGSDTPEEGEGQQEEAEGPPEAPPDPFFPDKDLLEPETWTLLAEEMLSSFVLWLPSLLTAILILVAFFVLYRLAAGVLNRVMSRTRADPAAQTVAIRLTRYSILVIGAVMAASQLGIEVGSLLAGVGIIGLAIGLAAQDSLANLVAGITILWDRPFRIGDNVTVSGTFGKVKEIGLRTTRIRTVEQLDTILPNKEIINEKLVNHTLNPLMRLGIPIGIAYKEDTRVARKVLLAAVEGHEMILEQPEPAVVVTGLGDSSVNLELRVWLRDPHDERPATFAMVEAAKIALDEAGIEIPFPQRTLHFPDPVSLRRSRTDRSQREVESEPESS